MVYEVLGFELRASTQAWQAPAQLLSRCTSSSLCSCLESGQDSPTIPVKQTHQCLFLTQSHVWLGPGEHPVSTTPFFTFPPYHLPTRQRIIPEQRLCRLNVSGGRSTSRLSYERAYEHDGLFYFPLHSNHFPFQQHTSPSLCVLWECCLPSLTCCGLPSQPVLPTGEAEARTL